MYSSVVHVRMRMCTCMYVNLTMYYRETRRAKMNFKTVVGKCVTFLIHVCECCVYCIHVYTCIAGASLVQWNRLNGDIIASAHDSEIRLWDMRVSSPYLMSNDSELFPSPQKPATAWGYMTAHMTRIHDIDWGYQKEHQLTTCSHDSSVKFWDTSSPREPISTIKTRSQPIWRAKNYVRI